MSGRENGTGRGDLLDQVFRASPSYELVLFDRLSETERAALSEAAREPGFYGVLRPTGEGGTVKTVDTDTALLLHTLREPGPFPGYSRGPDPHQTRSAIARLVLDGVLEVEDGGRFVTGPDAWRWVRRGADGGGSPSRIPTLSRQALGHVARLGETDARVSAAVLYGYNRYPVRPSAARALTDSRAVLEHLGVPDPSTLGWRTHEPAGPAAWITLLRDRPGRSSGSGGRGAGGVRFKLYVSPEPAALPMAFPAILASLGAGRVTQFKIGANAAGLHRPDKIVAYFGGLEEVAACAESIRSRIDGIPAQGVPFTAAIGEDGLLSWGMDPPPEAQVVSVRGRESWRAWVTNRLGSALAQAARRDPSGDTDPAEDAVAFALARVEADGIDTRRWTPETSIWNAYTREA